MKFRSLLTFAAPLAAAALHSGLVVSRYCIETQKLRRTIKIVLLADLHSTWHGERQQKLVRKIGEEHPDLILMAGDMLDEGRSFLPFAVLLGQITPMAPIYYVSGNHEYRIPNINHSFERMRRLGVTILHDRSELVAIGGECLLIGGIRDPDYARRRQYYGREKAMRHAFASLTDGLPYKILIAHRPECFPLYAGYPFDLIVSGHAHGGQVRLPFGNFGVYSHGILFPPYTSGIHELNHSKMLVSRGLSRFPFPPRVWNPPEVVALTLKGTANTNPGLSRT